MNLSERMIEQHHRKYRAYVLLSDKTWFTLEARYLNIDTASDHFASAVELLRNTAAEKQLPTIETWWVETADV